MKISTSAKILLLLCITIFVVTQSQTNNVQETVKSQVLGPKSEENVNDRYTGEQQNMDLFKEQHPEDQKARKFAQNWYETTQKSDLKNRRIRRPTQLEKQYAEVREARMNAARNKRKKTEEDVNQQIKRRKPTEKELQIERQFLGKQSLNKEEMAQIDQGYKNKNEQPVLNTLKNVILVIGSLVLGGLFCLKIISWCLKKQYTRKNRAIRIPRSPEESQTLKTIK